MRGNVLTGPFGGRGEAPFFFPTSSETEWQGWTQHVPGVQGLEGGIAVPYDLLPRARRHFKCEPEIVGRFIETEPTARTLKKIQTGYDRFRHYGLHEILGSRAYQVQTIRENIPYDYRTLALPLRWGKSLVAMALAVLRGAQHITIFCPGYLKPTWTAEVLKWFPDARIVYLEGKSGGRGYLRVGRNPRKRINDKDLLIEEMRRADFVICNYDILNSHHKLSGAGKAHYVAHLTGMAPTLWEVKTDCVILDEGHEIAAPRNTSTHKPFTRGDILAALYKWPSRCKLAYNLSGTPIGLGDPLKIWQIWRILAGANDQGELWGSKHWAFSVRYCGGQHIPDPSGYSPTGQIWVESGFTNKREYLERFEALTYNMTDAPRPADMPTVQYLVRTIDPGDKKWKVPKTVLKSDAKQRDLMIAAAKYKAGSKGVMQEILKPVREGLSIQVNVLHHDPYEKLWGAIRKAVSGDPELKGVKIWGFTGQTPPDVRQAQAEAINACVTPFILVCTARSVRGGLSFPGVREVHWVELTANPYVMFQAEGRGLERGQADITSVLYAIEGSYDDKVAEKLAPRLARLHEIQGEPKAAELQATLEEQTKKEVFDLFAAMAGMGADSAYEDEDPLG